MCHFAILSPRTCRRNVMLFKVSRLPCHALFSPNDFAGGSSDFWRRWSKRQFSEILLKATYSGGKKIKTFLESPSLQFYFFNHMRIHFIVSFFTICLLSVQATFLRGNDFRCFNLFFVFLLNANLNQTISYQRAWSLPHLLIQQINCSKLKKLKVLVLKISKLQKPRHFNAKTQPVARIRALALASNPGARQFQRSFNFPVRASLARSFKKYKKNAKLVLATTKSFLKTH